MKEHLKQLYNTDPIARFEAIAALAKLGEPAVPALMEMLASPNRLACRSALNTLLRIDKPRFEPLLMPLLQREWKGVYGLSHKYNETPETILSDPTLSTMAKITMLKLLSNSYYVSKSSWWRVVVDSIEDYCARIAKDATVSAAFREGAQKVYEASTLLRASHAPETIEELLRPIYGKYDPSDPDFLLRATVQAEVSAGVFTPPPLREPERVKKIRDCVSIPEGIYTSIKSIRDNEPLCYVSILGCCISKYQVTVGEYKAYCRATGVKMPDAPDFNIGWRTEAHPIVNVNWEEARAYCAWVGGRLPTEAEWMVASRDNLIRMAYPWGENRYTRRCVNDLNDTVFVRGDTSKDSGCYDMAGNVWEWCLDTYDSKAWQDFTEMDAIQIEESSGRVLRGHSWNYIGTHIFRDVSRSGVAPYDRYSNLGFRIVF